MITLTVYKTETLCRRCRINYYVFEPYGVPKDNYRYGRLKCINCRHELSTAIDESTLKEMTPEVINGEIY